MLYTEQEVLDEMREVYDTLIASSYWDTFDHDTFKSEVYPLFKELTNLVALLKTQVPGYNSDTPFFGLHSLLCNDVVLTLTCISHYKNCETTEEFRDFYLPSLQSYLQLIDNFLNGINDENVLEMYMANNVLEPLQLLKYVPYYHEDWRNNEGYLFYFGINKWHCVQIVNESDVDTLLSELEIKAERAKKAKFMVMEQCYEEALIKDIKERTNFVYKVV